jgi:hypothetical protein
MATTTTNYGFDIPQSTDLVKDGATAIATLGQDIDTAMNTALGTKKAGMVLLNTTSFSAVASQSINDVFSSTYTNYKILFELTNCTVDGSLGLRMRTGGADASGSNTYLFAGGFYTSGSTAGAYASNGGTRVDLFDLDGGGSSGGVGVYTASIDLHNPNLSEYSVGNYLASATATDGTYRGHYGNFWHVVESPYTGFTILHSSPGTITGQIQVFGYNK